MNAPDLTRHYAKLTPAERFRAIAAAQARHDYVERDRLTDSTPMRTYTGHDMDAQVLHERALALAHVFTSAWHGRYWRWIYATVIPGWKPRRGKKVPMTREAADYMAYHAAVELVSMYAALRRVCDRIGLPLETYCKAYMSELTEDFGVLRECLTQFDPDGENPLPDFVKHAAEWFRVFRNVWSETPFAPLFADGGRFLAREDREAVHRATENGGTHPLISGEPEKIESPAP